MTAMTPDQRPAGAFSDPDLLRRVASAVALIPLALAAAWWGGWPFAVFWFLAACAVLWEWNRLVLGEAAVPLLAGEAAALAGALVLARLLLNPAFVLVGLGLGAVWVLAAGPRARARWVIAGLLYAAAVVLGPVILREDATQGLVAVFWLFALVWGADVGAYFAGRAIGGPRLWPRLSPKKTWAGFVGAIAAGTGLALLVAAAAGLRLGAGLVLVTATLAALSQAGDLLESAVKRRFAAKDASALIPGHGGVMDRLDGFLVAATAAVLFGLARGGPGAPAAGVLVW